jgi:hypothetical protein
MDQAKNHNTPIPNLNKLSDIIFLNWKSLTSPDPNRIAALKYIFRRSIRTPDTIVILDTIGSRMGYRIRNWPGVDLPIADTTLDYGAAALGTVHGAGVAYILLQHKDYFPEKTISKIRVWKISGTYNMLFFIEDIVPPSP